MFRIGDMKPVGVMAPLILKALQKFIPQANSVDYPYAVSTHSSPLLSFASLVILVLNKIESQLKTGVYMAMGQMIKRLPKVVEPSALSLFSLFATALGAETDHNTLSAIQESLVHLCGGILNSPAELKGQVWDSVLKLDLTHNQQAYVAIYYANRYSLFLSCNTD
jgi:hypothetical protein